MGSNLLNSMDSMVIVHLVGEQSRVVLVTVRVIKEVGKEVKSVDYETYGISKDPLVDVHSLLLTGKKEDVTGVCIMTPPCN